MGARYPRIHRDAVEEWYTLDGVSHARFPCADLHGKPEVELVQDGQRPAEAASGWLCTLCVGVPPSAWLLWEEEVARRKSLLRTAGGPKGSLIQEWFIRHKRGTLIQVSEAVGCTRGRVYEVCKALGAVQEGDGVWALDPFPFDL